MEGQEQDGTGRAAAQPSAVLSAATSEQAPCPLTGRTEEPPLAVVLGSTGPASMPWRAEGHLGPCSATPDPGAWGLRSGEDVA